MEQVDLMDFIEHYMNNWALNLGKHPEIAVQNREALVRFMKRVEKKVAAEGVTVIAVKPLGGPNGLAGEEAGGAAGV